MQRSYLLLLFLSVSMTASAMENNTLNMENLEDKEAAKWDSLQEILNEPRQRSISSLLEELKIRDDVENPSLIRQILNTMSIKTYNKLVAKLDKNKEQGVQYQQQQLVNILLDRQVRQEEKCNNLLTQKDDQISLSTKMIQKLRKQLAGVSIGAIIIFAYAVGLSVYTLPFV